MQEIMISNTCNIVSEIILILGENTNNLTTNVIIKIRINIQYTNSKYC